MPRRVFHGTSHAFDRFEPAHLGRSVRNPTTEFCFFFSEDADDAAYWAHRAVRYGRSGGAPRLITAEVRIGSPVLISPPKFQFYHDPGWGALVGPVRCGGDPGPRLALAREAPSIGRS
jgi:hypothetical protein